MSQVFILMITVVVIIALIVAAYKYATKDKYIRTQDYAKLFLAEIKKDQELGLAYKTICENQDWYDEKFHSNKELQTRIDKFFSVLSQVSHCYLSQQMSKSDFGKFKNYFDAMVKNKSYQKYLRHLYQDPTSDGLGILLLPLLEVVKNGYLKY